MACLPFPCSLPLSSSDYLSVLPVKMFIEASSWDKLEISDILKVPFDELIVTNLLAVC
jgi:hypothetical protein